MLGRIAEVDPMELFERSPVCLEGQASTMNEAKIPVSPRGSIRASIKCGPLCKSYEIELPTDAKRMEHYWRRTISSQCPYCGDTHLDGFKQLYMEAVLGGHVPPSDPSFSYRRSPRRKLPFLPALETT